MSDFDDIMAGAVDDLYDRDNFGLIATYIDRNHQAQEITVIRETNLSQYGEAAQVNGAVAILRVRRSQLPFAPRREEQIIVLATPSHAERTYIVDSTAFSDDSEHGVLVA